MLTCAFVLVTLSSQDVLPVCVKYGSKIFSHGLAGSSVLIADCVNACSAVLTNRRGSEPRSEALHLLGSMLFLPELYSNASIPDLSAAVCETKKGRGAGGALSGASIVGVASKSKGIRGAELREQIIGILFDSAKKEPMRIGRCAALYQLGMLAFSELKSGRLSNRLPEAIEILLASLQVRGRYGYY